MLREHLSVSPKRTQSTGSPPLQTGRPLSGAGGYLEERGILVPVVVLFACVLPRYPEDALLLVLPHQAGVFAAVHLLDEPLAQFAVAAAGGASVIHVRAHLCAPSLLRHKDTSVSPYSGEKKKKKTFKVWALPAFPAQTQIVTETLFKKVIDPILPAKLETGQVLESISHRESSSRLWARLNPAAYGARRAETEPLMLSLKAPAAAASRCASASLRSGG